MRVLDLMFVRANQVEAAFWIVIAVAMTVAALRKPRLRFDCLVAAAAFALFGLSDLVETRTGAWWRPWWLLLWKAACVTTFLWLLKRHIARRRGARPVIPRTAECESTTPSH